jgi:hypothetical protein
MEILIHSSDKIQKSDYEANINTILESFFCTFRVEDKRMANKAKGLFIDFQKTLLVNTEPHITSKFLLFEYYFRKFFKHWDVFLNQVHSGPQIDVTARFI